MSKKDKRPRFATVTGKSGRVYTAPWLADQNGFDLYGVGDDVGPKESAAAKLIY